MSVKPTALMLLLVVSLLACGGREKVDSATVVQERYRERIVLLTNKMRADCRAKVIIAASQRADSLLIERARRMRRIEGRPPRPYRPGTPAEKQLSAPLPLRPLFPFEIRFDTLLRDSLYQDSLRLDSISRQILPAEESL